MRGWIHHHRLGRGILIVIVGWILDRIGILGRIWDIGTING